MTQGGAPSHVRNHCPGTRNCVHISRETAVFLYFLGPEGFTYEYSSGVRRIEDDTTWRPRTFDPDEPGSIDM